MKRCLLPRSTFPTGIQGILPLLYLRPSWSLSSVQLDTRRTWCPSHCTFQLHTYRTRRSQRLAATLRRRSRSSWLPVRRSRSRPHTPRRTGRLCRTFRLRKAYTRPAQRSARFPRHRERRRSSPRSWSPDPQRTPCMPQARSRRRTGPLRRRRSLARGGSASRPPGTAPRRRPCTCPAGCRYTGCRSKGRQGRRTPGCCRS